MISDRKKLKKLLDEIKKRDPIEKMSYDEQYELFLKALVSLLRDWIPKGSGMPEFDLFFDTDDKLHLITRKPVKRKKKGMF